MLGTLAEVAITWRAHGKRSLGPPRASPDRAAHRSRGASGRTEALGLSRGRPEPASWHQLSDDAAALRARAPRRTRGSRARARLAETPRAFSGSRDAAPGGRTYLGRAGIRAGR